MGPTRTDGFRKDAVRIALTDGLTRKQVADDRDVGMLMDHGASHCPAVVCLQPLSIRIGQAGYSSHFRCSRSRAFAITMSLRMVSGKVKNGILAKLAAMRVQ